jgi:uncharacterized protein (TIGR00730 family)
MEKLKVTVFGAANTVPGEVLYEQALELGKLLAQSGFNVLTGGYIGTMEAVSRGAAEAGGHVIGVTCEDIEAWRKVKANAWVHEERRFTTLNQRLEHLITGCDAAIALPGGIGTLVEISLTWNQMVINAIPLKPFIIIGEEWHTSLRTLLERMGAYIPQSSRALISFAKNNQEVLKLLNQKLNNLTKF